MNILEDIRFERSLPRENRAQILGKIACFLKEWEENSNRSELSRQYSVRKVYGSTLLKEVWKFKVSNGNRVLFTKGKCLDFEEEGYEDAIILLRFCNHDEQIVKARSLSTVIPKVMNESDEESLIEALSDQEATEIAYDLEHSVTRVFKHISIEALMDLESLQGIYYLNKEQRHCVNTDYRPLILFGSAGSGKTTIGVYKLIDLLRQNPNIKVGYFTYSMKLAQSAQKIFHTVLQNEMTESEIKTYEERVDFYPLKDWLKEKGKADRLVQFETFNDQFYFTQRQNLAMYPEYKKAILSLESYEVWREIRGMIKGFAGEGWEPYLEGALMPKTEYLRLGSQHSSYGQEEREVIYEVALRYEQWLKAHQLMDENDVCKAILKQNVKQTVKEESYDWIVIDEVQDLTELEIYLLQTMVNEPGHFLLSGDYHQTIAPTYFDTKRIMSLLQCHQFRYKEDANRLFLTHNYRNPKEIVQLANRLGELRRQLFGKDKRNDYQEEVAVGDSSGNLFTLCGQKEEKNKLLKEAVKKAYVYIVVATEKEKKALEALLENKVRIFTIYEVKGLENKYIIGVNLLSHYKEKWQEILTNYKENKTLAENGMARYLINILYVTLTRTKESLCLIEDELDEAFIDQLLENMLQHEKQFNEVTFCLSEHSSLEDFYQEGLKFEAAEDYERAMAQYELINLPKAKIRFIYCKGKLAERSGRFLEAGKSYEKADALKEAMICYKKAKAYGKYYGCMIEVDEARFMTEVLLNPEIDYNRDLMPYMEKHVRCKIEEVCVHYYERRLAQSLEDKELSVLYLEELTEQMQTRKIDD